MTLNVGVNVIEVDGRASPTIQAAPTSVAAFLGLTERGIPNQAVRISSVQQLQAQFGGYRSDGYLSYTIEGFFLNGGQQAYVSRVVGANSVAAFVVLNGRQDPGPPQHSLRIAAGLRGCEDPGAWGERLSLNVRDDPQFTSSLKASTAANATSAQLQSSKGLMVGSIVRFLHNSHPIHRKITKVDSSTDTVYWDNTQPIATALDSATTQVSSTEFSLSILYKRSATADAAVVETWGGLSMEPGDTNYAPTLINNEFTGSRYITITDVSGKATSGDKVPAVVSNVQLGSSKEPSPTVSDFVGDQGQKTGLYAFDTSQIQLLAAPDAHLLSTADLTTFIQNALSYCSARNDCMFVGSVPDRGHSNTNNPRSLSDYDQLESQYLDQTMGTFSTPLQGAKAYGALYAPWIQVLDPVGTGTTPLRFVPPEGHVMGVYARTDQERGIWKAPAGIAAQVRGALDVAATFTDSENTDMVHTLLVNSIRFAPGTGITVNTSRTLSTDTRWWFVSTRLLFNFVKSSLRDGLRFVRQEPNTDQLRRTVRFNVVTPFLLGLWQQGAFGSDPPEKVFSVKCDAENNPPAEVDLGNFKIEVYFYPVKPAETILIVVGQQPSGATTKEG